MKLSCMDDTRHRQTRPCAALARRAHDSLYSLHRGNLALHHRGFVVSPRERPRSCCGTSGTSTVSAPLNHKHLSVHHNGHIHHLILGMHLRHLISCMTTDRLLSSLHCGNLLSVAQQEYPSFRRWTAPAAPTLVNSLMREDTSSCHHQKVNCSLRHDWNVFRSVDETKRNLEFEGT